MWFWCRSVNAALCCSHTCIQCYRLVIRWLQTDVNVRPGQHRLSVGWLVFAHLCVGVFETAFQFYFIAQLTQIQKVQRDNNAPYALCSNLHLTYLMIFFFGMHINFSYRLWLLFEYFWKFSFPYFAREWIPQRCRICEGLSVKLGLKQSIGSTGLNSFPSLKALFY